VIVSDQRMPGMPGVELLSHVYRESPETVRMLLTGYSDLAAIVGSVNEGEVYRFISKPWDQEDIRATMAEAASIGLMDAALPKPARAAAAPVAAPATAARPGLLLLDDSDNDRAQIAGTLGAEYTVYHASSIDEALLVLESHDIGVMVCEAQVRNRDTGELLHVLKNNFPAIITVMLTQTADSDIVIRLINQARIYRFATKPIRQAVLQLAVSAAMKEHVRCLTDVRWAARQRTSAKPDLEPSVAKGILQGLKALTMRWRLFAA